MNHILIYLYIVTLMIFGTTLYLMQQAHNIDR